MKKALFVYMGLSFFSLLLQAPEVIHPSHTVVITSTLKIYRIKEHFGGQEENPQKSLNAALDLANAGKEVPVDCPGDPEIMGSFENSELLFTNNEKGRLAPIVNGEIKKNFELRAIGEKGTLAYRRKVKKTKAIN